MKLINHTKEVIPQKLLESTIDITIRNEKWEMLFSLVRPIQIIKRLIYYLPLKYNLEEILH